MPNYTGTSIVDYLKSVGQPSDFAYRSGLAQQKGITNYTGTAKQNLQLLNILNVPAPAPASAANPLGNMGQGIVSPIIPPAPVVPPAPAQAPAPKTTAPKTTVPVVPPAEKPYVRNPNGLDVYDRAGNYISADKAAQIPGFWDLVDISATAPDTSKGQGLGGPVTGKNDGLGYISYNGIDVYEKATGRYIDFDTAKRLNIWNLIETSVDPVKLEELGIDPNGETPTFKDEGLAEEYKATESPYQLIYNDFKKSMGEANTKLENAWLEYNNAVIEIEENPWLLTGEVTQELNKLKRKSLAKIDALTNAKSNLLDEFNMALGITEKSTAWEEAQKKLTPEEESAQTLAEYEAKLQLEKKYETPKEPGTSIINTNGRSYLINDSTGEVIKDLGIANSEISPGKTTPSTKVIDTGALQAYLQNQQIPVSVADKKGALTTAARNKVLDAGVPGDVADWIWGAIQQGASFEEIRQAMRSDNPPLDTALLDSFVQALQPKKSTSETPEF